MRPDKQARKESCDARGNGYIERWQRLTGGTAVHAETGQPFPRTGNVPAADIGG